MAGGRDRGDGGRIDLHVHSSVSDGTDTPAEVVAIAAAVGVRVLGITDHDIAGLDVAAPAASEAARAAARGLGVTLVPGSEISCHWWREGRRHSAHLLAYLFRPDDAALTRALEGVRHSRDNRMAVMVERVGADHPVITMDSVLARAGGGGAVLGRPHLARALLEAGLVGSMEEAFGDDWLGHRGPYYERKASVDLEDAVGLVRGAGGVAVLAHPARAGYRVPADVIRRLADGGLDGIEVDHPWQPAEDRAALRDLAGELGLVVTGASDFHGKNKAERIGAEVTDPPAYAEIVRLAAERGGIAPVPPG